MLGVCGAGFLGLIVFSKIFGVVGLIMYPFLFLAALVAAIFIMRNAVAMGLKDLDASLIKTPIIGPIYEAWFRKETYYRQDTRLMYCDTVNAVVKAKVEETTGAKGIKLIRYMENCPLLNELYKPNDCAAAKGSIVTPHVPARRTIDRAVPPVGTARTRLAGVCRACFPRTAIRSVSRPLSARNPGD